MTKKIIFSGLFLLSSSAYISGADPVIHIGQLHLLHDSHAVSIDVSQTFTLTTDFLKQKAWEKLKDRFYDKDKQKLCISYDNKAVDDSTSSQNLREMLAKDTVFVFIEDAFLINIKSPSSKCRTFQLPAQCDLSVTAIINYCVTKDPSLKNEEPWLLMGHRVVDVPWERGQLTMVDELKKLTRRECMHIVQAPKTRERCAPRTWIEKINGLFHFW